MPISIRNFADVFAEVEAFDRRARRMVLHPDDFGVVENSEMFDRYTLNYEEPTPEVPQGMFWGVWVHVDAGVPQGKVLIFTADQETGSFYSLEPEEVPPAPEPKVYRPTQWERLLSGVDTGG